MSATIIERIALGRAASAYLRFSDPGISGNPYAGYLLFRAAVTNFANPNGISLSQDLENHHEVALDMIHTLAESITRDIKNVLELAKEGIVNESIECRLDSDMNALDMPGLVEIGHELESGGDDNGAVPAEAAESEAEHVLRRYNVGVTRVAFSREKTIPVLAMNEEDASARALELAHDMDFSSIDAEYECSVSEQDADALAPGEIVTWCDPSGGEKQDVIYRESHGEIVLCHTQGGGEVEVFPHELH